LGIISILDEYLKQKHPTYFGPEAVHPVLPIKRSKIIHDNLWGTNRFYWRELAIIDSPIFQRLRDIHQVGLSYQVYISARHTRFEHSLGVVTIASRIFDGIRNRQGGRLRDIVKVVAPGKDYTKTVLRWKQELRLAALFHDVGHSLHSHTSEKVYSKLDLLDSGVKELTRFVGKEKGAGEVLSFCLSLTDSVGQLLQRAGDKVIGEYTGEEYDGEIDRRNVALVIVGRATHPFLQFLGDIISSGFDADKLDYLMRDATNAGLPLRYDLDRYLFSVNLEESHIVDPENELEELYKSAADVVPTRKPSQASISYPYFEAYRLRLPTKAMNTIEQIVICKLMLFSYIYHHQKVRASEGMLQRLLERIVENWRHQGCSEEEILRKFLDMTDASLSGDLLEESRKVELKEYPYRLVHRLLPREVYNLTGAAATHAEADILADFLTGLQDRQKRQKSIKELEQRIGKEMLKIDPSLGRDADQALFRAGVWVDVPTPPKFEDVNELVVDGGGIRLGVPLVNVFPIGPWTEAYTHYRYPVRIFSFSEHMELTKKAAKTAMKQVIGIEGEGFYEKIVRRRTL
jgi:HD superfamily phosphohydrolase